MKFSIRLTKGVDDQRLEALLANPKIRKREELVFKIANDGKNPATAGIKGMQLELPADSQILESSITDKNLQSIQVGITTQNLPSGGRLLVVSFPPLKTGEFVTIKLSISGAMPDVRNMKFSPRGRRPAAHYRARIDQRGIAFNVHHPRCCDGCANQRWRDISRQPRRNPCRQPWSDADGKFAAREGDTSDGCRLS